MTASTYVVRSHPGQTPRWYGRRPRLGQLDIELTERCNNNCIHCCINLPANDAVARAREMTTQQVKDILQQAADLGCLKVRFTGGEPLLRSDAQELYLYARRLGLKVLLFTNARPITPHLADLFAQVPPLVPIEITVYGMRPESYEAVTRAPGSFAQFWRGVNLLLDRHVPFVVKSVLLPQLTHEIDEFEAWAETIPWMTRRPSYTMFLDLRNRRNDAQKNVLIESLRPSPQDGLALLTRDAAKYRRDMTQFASRFIGPPGDVLFGCGAIHGMCIDAYGCAQPCMGLRAPELTVGLTPMTPLTGEGGLVCPLPVLEREAGVASLGDALARFRQLREVRATNPEYLRRCARCFLKGLCEQCPAKSWVEHGTLDTPVTHLCEVAHAQARYLGWLGGNEHGWEVMNWQERVNDERLSLIGEGASCVDRPSRGAAVQRPFHHS
jgi:MoaA/NifB/PqqE/SkfB family radical SAM enzyme